MHTYHPIWPGSKTAYVPTSLYTCNVTELDAACGWTGPYTPTDNWYFDDCHMEGYMGMLVQIPVLVLWHGHYGQVSRQSSSEFKASLVYTLISKPSGLFGETLSKTNKWPRAHKKIRTGHGVNVPIILALEALRQEDYDEFKARHS